MGRFCQGGKFNKKKKKSKLQSVSIQFIQMKFFWLLCGEKGYEWGKGALWFVQLDACSFPLQKLVCLSYTFVVCSGMYSRISIVLKDFQNLDFITKQKRLAKWLPPGFLVGYSEFLFCGFCCFGWDLQYGLGMCDGTRSKWTATFGYMVWIITRLWKNTFMVEL